MSKKNEEKSQQALAENQDDAVQTANQTAINAQESAEQATKEKAASDDKNSQTAAEKTGEQKTPEPAPEESEVPADKPKLENLSVLADRHRIPAWHQAALLRYMGWQDDKMVTDEAYRKALDELKHRRIGGGRK